jgi:3-deoxy-D-manno-octulosonate 8-phosphate phosphatase KdsC-like HAD superfamily phosphatase
MMCGTVGGERKPGEWWRAWMFPLVWLHGGAASSGTTILPFYRQVRAGDTASLAVFPLFYDGHSDSSRDRSYFFLIWRGERKLSSESDSVERRKEYFRILPSFFQQRTTANGRPRAWGHSVVPLYSTKGWDIRDDDGTEKGWEHTALLVAALSHCETTRHDIDQDNVENSIRLWPLFRRDTSTIVDGAENGRITQMNHARAALLFSRFFDRQETADGHLLRETAESRIWPLLFWGHDSTGYEFEDKHHVVLFPVFWHGRDGANHLTAVVPLGAHIVDDDVRAINILGPFLTYLDQRAKGYKRVDMMFPVFMAKFGQGVRASRAWPLYSYHHRFGRRRSSTFMWPLVHRDEGIDAVSGSLWTPVFSDLGLFRSPRVEGESGGLASHALPFYMHERSATREHTVVFPLFHRTQVRSRRGRHDRLCVGPWGIVSTSATDTEQGYREHWLLGGAYGRGTGARRRMLNLGYVLCKHRAEEEYLSHRLEVRRQSSTMLLGGLYTRGTNAVRSLTEPRESRVSLNGMALLWRRRTRVDRDHDREQTSGYFELGPVPPMDWQVYRRGIDQEGTAEHRIIPPLYTSQTNRYGVKKQQSLWGLLFRRERDGCGYGSTAFCERLLYVDSNSRRTKWCLGPVVHGRKSEAGESLFGVLGGIFDYVGNRDGWAFRFMGSPMFSGKRTPAPITAREMETVASRHFDLGILYLRHGQPAKAAIELRLAEPAFRNDPEKYEVLGDAYVLGRDEYLDQDAVVASLAELDRFAAVHPTTSLSTVAEQMGWKEAFRQEAVKVYDMARACGGDSAVLRRKEICIKLGGPWPLGGGPLLGTFPVLDCDKWSSGDLSSEDTAADAAFKDALSAFPDDFSLWVDYASFLRWRPKLRDETEYALNELKRRFPDSLLVEYIAIHQQLADIAVRYGDRPREILQRALVACRRTKDTPRYLPVWATEDTPNAMPLLRELAARLAFEIVEAHAWQGRTTVAADTIPHMLALHEGASPVPLPADRRKKLFEVGRTVYTALGSPDQWIGMLAAHLQNIALAEEREPWERELHALRRDRSYIRHWGAFVSVDTTDDMAPGAPRRHTVEVPLDTTFVDLRRVFPDCIGATGTAVCAVTVETPRDVDAQLLLGFDDDIDVAVNGNRVFHGREVIAVPDEHSVPIMLKKGANRLVLRVRNRRLAWGFYARIADCDGNPVPGLAVTPDWNMHPFAQGSTPRSRQ